MKEIQDFYGLDKNLQINLNIKDINWDDYLTFWCYGLQKYVLNLLVDPPGFKGRRDILVKLDSGNSK